jgi:AcrR family transcriptional regulator
MGRKAIERDRKSDEDKTQPWIITLFTYFQENGLKGITMDVIAKELGRSKTTVYDYFQTKEEIIEQAVEYKLNQIAGFKDIIRNQEKSFKQRCYDVLKFQTNHISDISNIFLTDLRDLYPKLWVKVEAFLDNLSQEMASFYQKGAEEKEFNPIHPSILVLNDQLFFRTLTNPDFLSTHKLTLQEAFDQYSQLRFFGIIRNEKD